MAENLKVIGAAGSAVGLGGFAAALGLCCSVPWAVALLGVSGAIAFARLAFLLPYALLGAAVFLGCGFWLAYRKPACADGACPSQPPRVLRWTMWGTKFPELDSARFAREVHNRLQALNASGVTPQ